MINTETREHIKDEIQLSLTLPVEATALTCLISQNLHQAKRILLYFVQNKLQETAEYSSILQIVDTLNLLREIHRGK